MKRTLIAFLAGILSLGFHGCKTTTPKGIVRMDYPLVVSQGNEITVTECFIQDDSIIVCVFVDFVSRYLWEFEAFSIRKTEDGQASIPCDLERTREFNQQDIFQEGPFIQDIFYLVFPHESINANTKVSQYVLEVPILYSELEGVIDSEEMELG